MTRASWIQSDITDQAGGWVVGRPATSPVGRGVFVRRADNHLVHYYFNADREWEQWDVSELAGGWAIGGDPAPSYDGSSVYIRRADNHLAHFFFNAEGRVGALGRLRAGRRLGHRR